MRPFTVISCERNDTDIICTEWTGSPAKGLVLGTRSVGIAICDSSVDYSQVLSKFSKLCSFEIIGCTPLGFVRTLLAL